MARQQATFYLNTMIIGATLSLVLIDGILQGHAQMIGLFISLSIVAFALVANFVVNHEEIMELNAPGARLYQRAVRTAAVVASVVVR